MTRCKSFRPFRCPLRSLAIPGGRTAVLCGLIVALPVIAQADHVLIGPGRGLFNVSVESSLTTPTNLATIRVDPTLSFGLDVRRGIFPLSGMAVNAPVMDYELTTVTLGKVAAKRKLEYGPWARVRMPAPQIVTLFTPAPPPTPTPEPTPVPTPDPARLADRNLSPFERIDRQLNIFVQEQQALVENLPPENRKSPAAHRARLELLDDQIQLLKQNYPSNDMATSSGLEAMLGVRQRVFQSGQFAHENN